MKQLIANLALQTKHEDMVIHFYQCEPNTMAFTATWQNPIAYSFFKTLKMIKMKRLIFFTLLLLTAYTESFANTNDEQLIRKLEQQQLESVKRGDTVMLSKLWSKDLVVNNPLGQIVTVPQIFSLMRSRRIDYSNVETVIEKVTFTGNLAIAMGQEIVTPQNAAPNAGNKVTRRFTDVWLHGVKGWQMVARQATNILVEKL